METDPAEPIMISALEHYSYCPRQCGLIHLEHAWDENLYTMRGREVHENVDRPSEHIRGDVRYERGLPIWSDRLKLTGKADLVEFHGETPYPVEYKSGRHRAGKHEALQLCAQAVCLEEMFGVPVPKGALYWHGSRERTEVILTDGLRLRVEETAAAFAEMMENGHLPPPVNDKRCLQCSLKESCLPHVVLEKEIHRRSAVRLFDPGVT